MSVQDREDAVVARLHALAPHLDGEPDPAFRAATRARLVAMAAVRSPEPAPVSPFRRVLAARAVDSAPGRWRTRLTAGLAGAALSVTALATLVALSTDARPGDALYGLKRGTEQTQLALAGDARGRTLLDFASTRLEELRELTSSQAAALPAAGGATGTGTVVLAAGPDPELVIETLDTMDEQTADGAAWLTDRSVTTGDPEPLDYLAAWAEEQSAGLAALAPALPQAAAADAQESLVLLADVATRTVGLQSALTCEFGPAVDGRDGLGPLPGLCLPEPTTPGTTGAEPTTPDPTLPTTGSTTAPVPSTPALPSVGLPTPSLPPVGGGTGTGGGGSEPGGGGLPLPTPTLPLPLPPLPGTDGSTETSPSTTPPIVDLDVCLGPIHLGDC